jgi:multiple sugar transport system ATP-binding protein
VARVNLRGVSKRYTGKRVVDALRPLDLQIEDGEFITILGPSGCGKTTLLSIIVGIVPPSTGQVLVDGRDITVADPRDRDMAMVFQNYALYPSKTVRGNLEFPLRMRDVPRGERRRQVDEVAAMLGLTQMLEQYPRQLSGGQQQRVALGRALIRRPKLFLMDEPLSNLDAKLRVQMRSEIKRLHRQFPITTIYVTHDQSEALTLSDRVVVMNRGVVAQVGSPAEIYHQPADSFVADFVGSPAMNLLSVTLRTQGGQTLCMLRDGQVAARVVLEEAVSPAEGRLGIRPSQVQWQPRTGNGDGRWLRATVREVDVLGEDIVIYAQIAGEPLTILERGGRQAEVGQDIEVTFPAGALHLFGGEHGTALAIERTPAHAVALAE